jgi:hypothetical protein
MPVTLTSPATPGHFGGGFGSNFPLSPSTPRSGLERTRSFNSMASHSRAQSTSTPGPNPQPTHSRGQSLSVGLAKNPAPMLVSELAWSEIQSR